MTRRFVIGLTIADLDYVNLTRIYAYDRLRRHEVCLDTTDLGPLRPGLPDHLPPFTVTSGPLTFSDHGRGTRISVDHERVKVALEAVGGDDALGVVVPWSARRFQYRLKDMARPVSGTVEVDGEREAVLAGWGVLDRGRGVWPYRMTWNWGPAAATPRAGGSVCRWAGSGPTTPARPRTGCSSTVACTTGATTSRGSMTSRTPDSTWTVTGPDLEAILTPFHRRVASTQLGVIASHTHQAFGRWSGWARGGKGVEYRLDGLVGWAEQAHNRW
jgi:hypothetical protein